MAENRHSSGESPAFRLVAFEDFRFDPGTGELWRGDTAIKLPPRVAELLHALTERPMQIVTKQELIERVWDGKAVGDDALTSCIQELRKALGDDARAPRFIETRHRRGYRLLVPAGFAASAAPVEGSAPSTALEGKPSIAVLPFENLSVDQDYFADGIVEDIIVALSRFKSLFVIARNSSFSYKGKAVDIRQIGRELGARYVLEGSIRRVANHVCVTGQLVDTLNGRHIWAERYDRILEDIFAVQEEITRAIVGAIEPQIHAFEWTHAARRRPENLTAYEIALRALAHALDAVGKGDRSLIEQAIREAEQALAIDPHSVRALQSLAYAHGGLLLLRTGIDREEVLSKATQAATRAIELDPADAHSYALRSLAILRGRQMDRYAEALADAQRAHILNPNQIEALRVMAALEAALGEHERSIEHAHQVMRQSPRDPLGYINFGLLAFANLGARRYADGAAWASRALETRPEMIQMQDVHAACLVALGQIDRAKAVFKGLQAMDPDYAKLSIEGMWWLYARPEDRLRMKTLMRIAAGIEDPAAADAVR
jgi:TolB-like protein